ncbi:MAG: polyprenyl synthetase family protein [Phycisphaerales bacterium]|nr:polyprenyl synthetase family protein [Phycisphaerales bacterium]
MQPTIDTPPAAVTQAATAIESELTRRISQTNLPQNLKDAALYAVSGGGKRVRPALTLLCCEAVGGQAEDAIASAVAVEYIHCFSLVHDDLPCIDNDDLRRGQPTLHIKTNEAMAVLAGDLLLPLAMQQISDGSYTPELEVKLCQTLSKATVDMVGGQVYDTLGGLPERLNTIEGLELIHRNKTGALIHGACRMGALCGNATQDQLHAIETFGHSIGLMFQIVDDLIDLQCTTDHVGKATGKDAAAGKTTYPGVLGVEESKSAIDRLKKQAKTAVDTLGNSGNTLQTFNVWMACRTR